MIIKIIGAVLLACGTAGAQELVCPKYQHVDHWIGRCGPSHCQSNSDSWLSSCDAVCEPVPPDHCVDDLHVVTEKEWQDLQSRLKALENPPLNGNVHIQEPRCDPPGADCDALFKLKAKP